jgi:hypothetical protein
LGWLVIRRFEVAQMSAFGGKADMTICGSRFRGRYWG